MSSKKPGTRISNFFRFLKTAGRLGSFTTKNDNLDPTKIGAWSLVRKPPVPVETVIQGKTRNPNSKAYKTFQNQEGARLRKALKRISHGRNIFVYNNLRTNQVVYSLTRYLEKENVLSQLVYHGKKTVPASLRKDLWSPFYSVHFDDPKVGLRAYHLLREFSMQRQLSPPKDLISTTERWLDRKRPRDLLEAEKFDEENKKYLGSMLTKKERARVLMDQKATSVADIAAVLEIQEVELGKGFGELKKRGYLTRKARMRRRHAKEHDAEVTQQAVARVQAFADQLEELTGHSIEDPTGQNEYAVEPEQVKILWTDIYDAHYAKSWPQRVSHGHLALTRDHVMPGQKAIEELQELQELSDQDLEFEEDGNDRVEILAHHRFAEKSSPTENEGGATNKNK